LDKSTVNIEKSYNLEEDVEGLYCPIIKHRHKVKKNIASMWCLLLRTIRCLRHSNALA